MTNRTMQSSVSSGKFGTASIGQAYLFLLMLFAPITSYLIVPIQGLTPANALILLSTVIPFLGIRYQFKTYLFISAFLVIYIVLLVAALLSNLINLPNLVEVIQIRSLLVIGWLRISNITQGVYLLCAAIFFFHCYNNASERLIKYAFWGINLLLAYGFYEFFYYAVVGSSGDFISNRVFGDIEVEFKEGEYLNGSLVQQSLLFGSRFMRFKSLTGEPSMFSLTAVPFFVYAFVNKHWKTSAFLIVALILSNSTTAIIGVGAGLFVVYYRKSQVVLFGIPAFFIICGVLYGVSDGVQRVLDQILFEKLGSSSGSERLESMFNHIQVVFDGNIVRLLFGLGFGTVRSIDMFSNIIANTGIIGFFMYSAIILSPAFFLKGDPQRIAFQAVLISIWAMEMLSVSEFAYLPPWFFVAIAHKRARIFEKLGLEFGQSTNRLSASERHRRGRATRRQAPIGFSSGKGRVN